MWVEQVSRSRSVAMVLDLKVLFMFQDISLAWAKVCAVVIHPTSKLKSHFSAQYLISNIMSQEKSNQCA